MLHCCNSKVEIMEGPGTDCVAGVVLLLFFSISCFGADWHNGTLSFFFFINKKLTPMQLEGPVVTLFLWLASVCT